MYIERGDGMNQDFVQLCCELDGFLNQLVGGEENRAEYVAFNQLTDIDDVFIAYDGVVPVGCAAYKDYDGERAEVKRVFVREEYRGQGVGRLLMEKLTQEAHSKGYRYLILESGEPLAAAMGLYREIGFQVIPNYGQYADMPESICMQKQLKG